MASVPSIMTLVRLVTVPSNASFKGSLERRAFNPDRLPERAARKSEKPIEPLTRSPCQLNWPVAANELEIEGHASD
jgi:hypothetical protein